MHSLCVRMYQIVVLATPKVFAFVIFLIALFWGFSLMTLPPTLVLISLKHVEHLELTPDFLSALRFME